MVILLHKIDRFAVSPLNMYLGKPELFQIIFHLILNLEKSR